MNPPHDGRNGGDEEPNTDPFLLHRIRDLRRDRDWTDFVDRYDPLIRLWCRRAGVAAVDLDDVVQSVWMKLVRKLGTFDYDPSGRFRGWLRRLVEHHALDHLRALGRTPSLAAGVDVSAFAQEAPGLDDEPLRPALLEQGRRIQEAVRARIAERSWLAFQRCAIDGESVADVAKSLDMDYAAAYMAVARTRRKLREAGERELAAG